MDPNRVSETTSWKWPTSHWSLAHPQTRSGAPSQRMAQLGMAWSGRLSMTKLTCVLPVSPSPLTGPWPLTSGFYVILISNIYLQYLAWNCSIPLFRGSKTLIGKRLSGSDAKWDVYLDIFTGLTWILISLTLLVLSASLVILSEQESSGNVLPKYSWTSNSWFNLDRQTKDIGEQKLAMVWWGWW